MGPPTKTISSRKIWSSSSWRSSTRHQGSPRKVKNHKKKNNLRNPAKFVGSIGGTPPGRWERHWWIPTITTKRSRFGPTRWDNKRQQEQDQTKRKRLRKKRPYHANR